MERVIQICVRVCTAGGETSVFRVLSDRVSLSLLGRSFVIQQIPSSNLFMVVVDNKCDCSMFEPITMNPIEIMYILR